MLAVLLVALLGLTASIADAANDWVNLLAQDPTGGLVTGHLCYSTNGHDISCDGGAPSITSGTLYVPTSISSTNGYFGTVSATTYYGDGSHLTGISASAINGLITDRITSGTTSVVANSNTGIISITNLGVTGGYFNSNGVLTAPGISATANLTSVTTLYATSKVGIGVPNPNAQLDVNGTVSSTALFTDFGTSTNGNLHLTLANAGATRFGLGLLNTEGGANTGSNFGIWRYDDTQTLLGTALFIRRANGQVGVGTSSPNAALDVIGNISASNVYVTGTTGTVSATYGYFTYISATNLNGGGGTSGDRIVSGTLSAIANSATGYISLTTGATNWGYLSSGQSFIPTISTTNTGVSNVLGFTGQSVTTVAGSGGNYIVSGSASVSATTAGGGFISMAVGSGVVTKVGSSGLGIGITPAAPLHTFVSAIGSGSTEVARFDNAGRYLSIYSTGNGSGSDDVAVGFGKSTSADYAFYNSGGHAAANRIMTLADNGHVGIGVTSPAGLLELKYPGNLGDVSFFDASNGALFMQFRYAGSSVGAITTNGSATIYGASSDRRLKENIADTAHGLNDLEKIQVRDFNFIADPSKTRVQGFIAQELYKLYPEAVTVGGANPHKKPWVVDYGRLTPLLVKAIQELKAQNDDLQRQIDELKAARHD